MRTILSTTGLLTGWAAAALAAEPMTAGQAVKVLPKEQKKALARIYGSDGAPAPERWHILVHDPAVETGLKEFVVAGGAIVSTRGLSQFSEKLTPEEVIGDSVIKWDSDRAAKLLQQYAEANQLNLALINYELRKEGAEAAPLWKLTGYDVAGQELGSLVLTAAKGVVVSHPGFALEPGKPVTETAPFRTYSSSQVSKERTTGTVPAATPPPKKPGLFKRLFKGGNAPGDVGNNGATPRP